MTNTTPSDSITLFGSFTSSSTYKPMLYLALARLPFSFRTVNLKYGAQKEADYLAVNRYGSIQSGYMDLNGSSFVSFPIIDGTQPPDPADEEE